MSEIHLGDCMDGMREMPDNYIDLAIVDPPYGIGESRGQFKSRNANRIDRRNGNKIVIRHEGYEVKDWDSKRPTKEYFIELIRISKNQIIWGGNYFADNVPPSPAWVVWDKVNGDSDFSDCELAWTSFKTAVRQIEFMWSGMIQASSVITGRVMEGNVNKREKRIHPTQKPVALYKWLLSNYAKEGDLILDTHMGSGSSYIACLDMGFDYIGYEIDADYFKAIEERVYHFTRQEALF